jgi:F0F1-type ATP synthase assembly protein I
MPTNDPKPNEGEKKGLNMALAFAAAQMGFLVAGGLLGGLWIDGKMQTTPLFGFIGIIAGFVSGIRLLMRLVRNNR